MDPPPPPPEENAPVSNSSPSVPNPEVKTLFELQGYLNDWCLLYDDELHRYLKSFSADLFSKTKRVQDSLDALVQSTNATEVRLNNAVNSFLMLSDTQFIENRVYDEEETTVTEDDQTTNQEDEQESETEKVNKDEKAANVASVVEKYRGALDMGLQAMKLFAMLDDYGSVDEDGNPVEKPQDEFSDALDIYNERPLPFIIGTRDFLEDDTLGLGAAPEESLESASQESQEGYESSASSLSDCTPTEIRFTTSSTNPSIY